MKVGADRAADGGGQRRVVLLEIVSTDRYRNYRSQHFPFLLTLLGQRADEASWRCLGVEAKEARSDENVYVHDLSEEERHLVAKALGEAKATHVLLNERLSGPTWRDLTERAQGVSFSMVETADSRALLEGVGRWLGLDPEPGVSGEALLEESCEPSYGREPINALARQIQPFVHLLVGPECLYSRSIVSNPRYHGVDLAGCLRSRGCTFCLNPEASTRAPRTPPVELALRQIRAALATAPPSPNGLEYQVHGAALWLRVDELFDEILKEGLPPADFHFSSRIDELLTVRERLERALPRLEGTGHRVCLYNIGIESFSPAENERFNKGLGPDQIDAGIELARELEERFPSSFRCSDFGGFSLILFTPWTTVRDLRANIDGLRRHGIDAGGFVLDSALQLLPGLAITRLAEAQGLVADSFEDYPYDSGCITEWDQVELPWRFAQPEVRTIYSVARRLSGEADVPRQDPRYQLVQAWLGALPEPVPGILKIFEALLDVVEDRGAEPSTATVLRLIEQHLGLEGPGWLAEVVEDQAQGFTPRLSSFSRYLPAFWHAVGARFIEIFDRSRRARALLGGRDIAEVGVARCGSRHGLRLVLSRDDDHLELTIEERREGRPGFLVGDLLMLSYGAGPQRPEETDMEALRAVLGAAERVYAALRQP